MCFRRKPEIVNNIYVDKKQNSCLGRLILIFFTFTIIMAGIVSVIEYFVSEQRSSISVRKVLTESQDSRLTNDVQQDMIQSAVNPNQIYLLGDLENYFLATGNGLLIRPNSNGTNFEMFLELECINDFAAAINAGIEKQYSRLGWSQDDATYELNEYSSDFSINNFEIQDLNMKETLFSSLLKMKPKDVKTIVFSIMPSDRNLVSDIEDIMSWETARFSAKIEIEIRNLKLEPNKYQSFDLNL